MAPLVLHLLTKHPLHALHVVAVHFSPVDQGAADILVALHHLERQISRKVAFLQRLDLFFFGLRQQLSLL